MSILGFLNYFILQWFFIRLAKIIDDKTGKIIKWTILKWPYPLSGWGKKSYRYIGGKRK